MKSLLLLLIGQMLAIVAFTQTTYRNDNVIPASPTAAGLGKYGDIDVSMYNGTPDIAIPIYSINTPGHSLNIALRYDASGTRVAQDASWVGLGWSLQAGGVISRTVRGLDDFKSNGYMNTQNLPPNTAGNTYQDNSNRSNDYLYFSDVFYGNIDAEPDIYSYNFGGYSGRFVLGKALNGTPVFTDEKNNLKIEFTAGWQITTGDGYKYYFATPENTQGYNYSNSFDLTNMAGVSGLNIDVNSSPVTAWYLNSIVAPSGETMTFTYVNGKSLSLIAKSEELYQLADLSILNGCQFSEPKITTQYHQYYASRQAITNVYLNKISFTTGSLEFNTSPRSDIEYLNANDGLLTPSKLDNIVVKDVAGNELKRYSFSYSYFNNAANISGRLKLDAVTESAVGITKPPYAFTYISPNSLPDKYSKDIDHWGFYNNKNTSAAITLLPTIPIPNNATYYGADKDPDTVHNYPMNGVLSTITYPTGGGTTFEYELHDYGNLHGEQQYTTVQRYEFVKADPYNHPGQDIPLDNFVVHPDPDPNVTFYPATITCSYQKTDPNAQDQPSLGYTNMWKVAGDGSLTSFSDCNMANYDQQNTSPSTTYKNLSFGNYRMYLLAPNGFSTSMSCSWTERTAVQVTRRQGGGIRIKTITSSDAMGNLSVRKYLYTGDNGLTSGILLTPVGYDYSFGFSESDPVLHFEFAAPCVFTATFVGASSSSIFPSGLNTRAGIVGYSKVTELQGPNGENGRTEYYFHNTELPASNIVNIPAVPNPFNGKPDRTIVYNQQGQVVKKVEYSYMLKEDETLKGIKLFTTSPVAKDFIYEPIYYDNKSSWVIPVQEKTTLYNGSASISTTKTYQYDNNEHRLPTQITEDRSDGSISTTKFRRPGEFTISGTTSTSIGQGIANLQSRHIITPVIEQYTQYSNPDGSNLRTVEANFTSYKPLQPFVDVVYKCDIPAALTDFSTATITAANTTIDSRYNPQVTYDSYDGTGNPLQSHKRDDIRHSYIWDYKNSYPIAEVVNATSDAVAYTSFESDGTGGWDFAPGYIINNGSSITGSKNGSGKFTKTVPLGNYVASLWASGSVSVNGLGISSIMTSKKDPSWKYYEWKLSNVSSIEVQGNNLDEVRLYPANAQMTTYTYDPLIGITSQCDMNNKITYYEYDGLGRLKDIKDQDGNIIKTVEYHYKGQ